jgi:predicted transcriptional regulator of viral defense system
MRVDEISGRPLRVVVENPERLDVGAVAAGQGARVSSVERALLESAARPQLVGGIEVVASALAAASIDHSKLQSIAHELDLRAGLHRLGSITETLGLDSVGEGIEPMSVVGRYVSLDPSANDVVWRDGRWGVSWPLAVAELEEIVHR